MDGSVWPEFALYERRFEAFGGKSSGDKIQELVDREEVRELIAIYAHRVAHGRSVADLFTDDGSYIVRFPGRPVLNVQGRASLDLHFAMGLETLTELNRPLPMIHNLLLKITGDDALTLCSNELRMIENGTSMAGSGYYRDRLRRGEKFWKFAVRDMTFIHWFPLRPGWTGSEAGAANG